MPTLGPILECQPNSGRSGDRIRVWTNVPGVNLRNTQQFWFQVPPGATSGLGVTVLGFLAQFRAIDERTLEVTVPPVGDPAQGQLAPGPYVLVAQGGWYAAHTSGTFTVLAGASAAAPGPSVPVPRALVRNPIAPPGFPAGTMPTPPSPAGAPASPVPTPPTASPAPVPLPLAFTPPSLGTPISLGTTSPPGAPAPATMTPRVPEPPAPPDGLIRAAADPTRSVAPRAPEEEPPLEEYVRWLVEEAWPVFDTEDVVGYRAAVSATCLRYPSIPMRHEPARLVLAPHPSSRSATILGSGSSLAELKQPNGRDDAETNDEGKVFFLLDLPLLERREIFTKRERLHEFQLVLGCEAIEASFAPAAPGAAAPPPPGPGAAVLATRAPDAEPGWAERLLDILVPENARPVVTAIQYVGVRRLAEGAITAAKRDVVRLFLTEMAQYMRRTYSFAGISAAQAIGLTEDEENALYIGALLGAGRGVWVAGRDTVTDFYDTAALGVTILHKVFTFVSDDPLFALKLLGSLTVPGAGVVTYRLDAGFRARIDRYVLGFAQKAEQFASMMAQIAVAAWENRDVLFQTISTAIYQSFDRDFGYIATEYMGYGEQSMERAYFVAAFMAADVGAYIGTVITVEVLIGIATSGIGSYVSALAKAGRLRRIEPVLRALRRVYGLIEGVGDALHKKAAKAFITIIHFFGDIPGRYIGKALDVVEDRLERVVKMFLRFSEDAGERIKALVATINNVSPSPEGFARYIKMIVNWADGVSYKNAERVWPDGPGFAPVCRRA